MRSHSPSHARSARLPTVATSAATTAGLTLSLVPAVLAAGPAAASAASNASTPARPGTHLMMNEMGGVRDGRTALAARLVTKSGTHVPGARIGFQVHYKQRWVTVGRGTTNRLGAVRVAVPLHGLNIVRAYYLGTKTLSGTFSRAVNRFTLGELAVREARTHYGATYRYGSEGPKSFDCSGFSSYVYAQLGVDLPRTSRAQAAALRRVPVSAKRPGDLIFTYRGGRVAHVGIYAGGGKMWAATSSGDIVRLQSLYSRNITVGRIG